MIVEKGSPKDNLSDRSFIPEISPSIEKNPSHHLTGLSDEDDCTNGDDEDDEDDEDNISR